MPKATYGDRPSLPTSSTDFALPPSSSVNAGSSSSADEHGSNPLTQRFRRPSLLAPKANYLSESRLHSPLITSFTAHPLRRRRSHGVFSEESESDRDRMWTDSSPSGSSENPTPPLGVQDNSEDEPDAGKVMPQTPPRKTSSSGMDSQDSGRTARRLSLPLRAPRILNLLAESRPEEDEVKSEAAFQRLITSGSELPLPPRTPRNISDRGRYPEEAGHEESQREDTPSDDEEGEGEDAIFTFNATTSTSTIDITNPKPHTPAGSVNGDDPTMLFSDSPAAMDVDLPSGSPSYSVYSAPNQWRYTPPPTTSAVRSNKRKFDDRFDPYPTASKRRAVSPSLTYLRESHSSIVSPILNNRIAHPHPRLPISIPITIPGSVVSSAASSPTITSSSYPRSVSMTSSPTMRTSIGLASPILRPVPRCGVGVKRGDGEEKEIEGAGEAVGGLTLG